MGLKQFEGKCEKNLYGLKEWTYEYDEEENEESLLLWGEIMDDIEEPLKVGLDIMGVITLNPFTVEFNYESQGIFEEFFKKISEIHNGINKNV